MIEGMLMARGHDVESDVSGCNHIGIYIEFIST